MNPFRSIGVAGLAWRHTFEAAPQRRVLVPLLVLGVVDLLALTVLLFFYAPVLSWIAAPLVTWLGGSDATHYPAHLYALPAMYDTLESVVSATFVPLVAGVLCRVLARSFGYTVPREDELLPRSAVAPLVLVGILGVACTRIAEFASLTVIERVGKVDPQLVAWFAATVVALGFAYTVPWIVLRGAGLRDALWQGLRMSKRLFAPTFVLMGVPLALLAPLHVALPQARLDASSWSPELMVWLVALRVALDVVAVLFVVGAPTRIFVSRRGAPR